MHARFDVHASIQRTTQAMKFPCDSFFRTSQKNRG